MSSFQQLTQTFLDSCVRVLLRAYDVLQRAVSKGRDVDVATCSERGNWMKCGDRYWRGSIVVYYREGKVEAADLTVQYAYGPRGRDRDVALELSFTVTPDGQLGSLTFIRLGGALGLQPHDVKCVEAILDELERKLEQ